MAAATVDTKAPPLTILSDQHISFPRGRAPPLLTEAALHQLMTHDWPGNIRELENVIERAIILARDGQLRFEPGPAAATPRPPSTSSPLPPLSRAAMEKHQRDAIVAALERSGGRVSGPRGAAELLGMKASTLFSRMTALGLRPRST